MKRAARADAGAERGIARGLASQFAMCLMLCAPAKGGSMVDAEGSAAHVD